MKTWTTTVTLTVPFQAKDGAQALARAEEIRAGLLAEYRDYAKRKWMGKIAVVYGATVEAGE